MVDEDVIITYVHHLHKTSLCMIQGKDLSRLYIISTNSSTVDPVQWKPFLFLFFKTTLKVKQEVVHVSM